MDDEFQLVMDGIAEDEAVAREVQAEIRAEQARGVYRPGLGPEAEDATIERGDGAMDHPSVIIGPARVLAECEAKRRLIASCGDEAIHAFAPVYVARLS